MKAKRGGESTEAKYEVSRGCFLRLKERSCLHNTTLQGETTSVDMKLQQVIQDLARLINESVYVKQKIFNVDEIALYWKKMPFRTLVTREKAMHGFEISKHRLTLLLGDNVICDLKLKPMLIYHVEILRII